MEEHLRGENHCSASEYVLEDQPSNEAANTGSLFNGRRIVFLKKRCSIQNFKSTDELAVFCPKPDCRLFMSTNILACALHFKYAHSGQSDMEIFSMGKLDRVLELEIEKKHNCPECKHYHSKLVTLVDHLKRSKHFPEPKEDEINVFVCPFDDCHFKTVLFFSFKTHILNHKFFTNGGERVMCKIDVYKAPSEFYHVTRFGENSGHESIKWEIDCERRVLGDLLELHKNQQFNALNQVLKARKDQLGLPDRTRSTEFI